MVVVARDPDTQAAAARLRAAFAYAGMEPRDIAQALGVSARTVHRLRTGQAPIDRDLEQRVLEITGVPEWFLREGFGVESEPALAERVEALERQIATLPDVRRQIRAVRALASSLEAQQAEDAIRLAQLEEAVRALTATGHRGGREATPER